MLVRQFSSRSSTTFTVLMIGSPEPYQQIPLVRELAKDYPVRIALATTGSRPGLLQHERGRGALPWGCISHIAILDKLC